MKNTDSWYPIETAPNYETILTYHIGDLYPIVAFKLTGNDKTYWFRIQAGPEDVDEVTNGTDTLYRQPTHWLPLDILPDFPFK